jgi:adenine-specific DNA-methyltransferase
MFYEVIAPDGTIVIPKNPDGSDSRWRWGKEKLAKEKERTEWIQTKNGWALYFRIYAENNETKPAETIWFNSEVGSNRTSKLELTSICPDTPFDTPKPLGLIKRILSITGINSITPIVLDFFAGSGSTLHATMQLNSEDGGNRQCILVTNNENNICEEVTYERNKRVIQGYTNAKSVSVEGLSNNNLRYYKSEFVRREPSLKNKRELTQLATELLCIKEDCYTEQKIKIKQAKLFANARVTLLILFDDHIIPDAVDLIKGMDAKEIKVYVFSMGSDPYTEDFAEVLDKVTLCALPDAIYKAYQNVLPKKKRTVPLMEEVSETPTNENGEQLSIL